MKRLLFLPLALVGLSLTSCLDNADTSSDNSSVQVLLIDAPGDYKAVNIDLQNVQVNATDALTEDGWQDLGAVAGKYNLLDYVNGRVAIIAGKELPAGHIAQIRLVLGSNNTLTLKDGTVVDLKVPSGQTSGLKVKVDTDLQENTAYQFVLDFDVDKSIVARGNGEYTLKPVIRAVPFAAAGFIQGTVAPAAANPLIMAIRTDVSGEDTISTHIDSYGAFTIVGARVGTYRLEFKSAAPYKNAQREGLVVTADRVTAVGTVNLN